MARGFEVGRDEETSAVTIQVTRIRPRRAVCLSLSSPACLMGESWNSASNASGVISINSFKFSRARSGYRLNWRFVEAGARC